MDDPTSGDATIDTLLNSVRELVVCTITVVRNPFTHGACGQPAEYAVFSRCACPQPDLLTLTCTAHLTPYATRLREKFFTCGRCRRRAELVDVETLP